MTEDRLGWSTAERAEIANHKNNGSWTTIDRSEVPEGRSPGCAQVHGIDFDQTFYATMSPTSLRALSAIANSEHMKMRRWDFVAAYLQGDLERDEVVYCHAPPGYATIGADGRPH
eukprot:3399874-Pleurochrysis_carterae.AAC.1